MSDRVLALKLGGERQLSGVTGVVTEYRPVLRNKSNISIFSNDVSQRRLKLAAVRALIVKVLDYSKIAFSIAQNGSGRVT